MRVMFIPADYTGKVELNQKTIEYLKEHNYKTVGLYASVQFVNKLEKVKEQLQELDITIITSKAKRTNQESQLLGCDNYHDSLNLDKEQLEAIDAYLYVGDGKFHPLALVYAQKDENTLREVVCNDPMRDDCYIYTQKDIATILKRYRASLIKFLTANVVGVIHTIKPGQEQFRPSLALEEKYDDKQFYHFIDNNVSFDQLENFNFVDVWINTTCPRVGFDDQEKFAKGVVNLNDALKAKEILSKESLLTQLK